MFHLPRRIALIHLLLVVAMPWANNLFALDLIGYVPYYRLNSNYLNSVLPQQLPLLDEVRYFGLSVDGTGEIASLSGSVASQVDNIAVIQSIIDDLPEGQRPRLNITLGGAGVDSVFSSVASSASNRTRLAENIAELLSQTGATSVDIDWEHPDAGIERTTYYPALLKRIKEEVGADNRVYATVDPTVMIPNSVFSGENGIDGISLMTYDLGWWGNDPANPYNGEHSLHEYIEDSIDAWISPTSANTQRPYVWSNASWGNDVAPEKLGVGLPFYGRNIFNGNAYTYGELLAQGTHTGDGYYTIGGQTVWIPDEATIEARVQLAHDQGLQHIIIWEVAQDIAPSNSNSMLRIAADKIASLSVSPGDFNGDGSVDGRDFLVWQRDPAVGNISDWQANYGGPLLTASAAAIPEPSTLMLGICIAAQLIARPRYFCGSRTI